MKGLRWTLVIAVAVLLAFLGYSFFFASDETRIARTIEKGRRAFEKEQLLRMLSFISSDYRDEYGYEKSSLLGSMRTFFSEHNDIQVKILKMEITVTPEDGVAVVNLLLAFGGDVVDERFQGRALHQEEGTSVRIDMKKEGRAWRVVRFSMR